MLCRVLTVYVTLAFVCGARPNDLERLGPLWWVGPNLHVRPNDMYGMCILGNSISFVLMVLWLWFQVQPVQQGRARLDRIVSPHLYATY